MKNFDGVSMTGITEEDNQEILNALENDIELTVDEFNRIWNEGNVYIADCIEVEVGNGVLC
jgi:hypothetical protein